GAFFHGPLARLFAAGHPAIERFAVEEQKPAGLLFGIGQLVVGSESTAANRKTSRQGQNCCKEDVASADHGSHLEFRSNQRNDQERSRYTEPARRGQPRVAFRGVSLRG